MKRRGIPILAFVLLSAAIATAGQSHKLRETGEEVKVAKSDMVVVPTREWNRISKRKGKRAESWTLDGPQLNDLTFFGGVEAGDPLFKERNKKRDPLPKFDEKMLLIEVPELLEGTYRSYKGLANFQLISSEPVTFLERDGVAFSYRFTDSDLLTRSGEARAVIVDGALYMITFDAPAIHFFDSLVSDFRSLASSAKLK